jgi:hypothetical protein
MHDIARGLSEPVAATISRSVTADTTIDAGERMFVQPALLIGDSLVTSPSGSTGHPFRAQ